MIRVLFFIFLFILDFRMFIFFFMRFKLFCILFFLLNKDKCFNTILYKLNYFLFFGIINIFIM